MVAVLWVLRGSDQTWLEARTWVRAMHLTGLVAAGGGTYFAVLFLLGFRPRDFARRES